MILLEGLPPGVACAQAVHAAGESARLVDSLPQDTRVVVLEAPAPVLRSLPAQLSGLGRSSVTIEEPDPPFKGAMTALGVAPGERTVELYDLLRHLRLYGVGLRRLPREGRL